MATKSLDLEASSSQYANVAASGVLAITGSISIGAWVKFESFNVSAQGEDAIVRTDVSINTGGYALTVEDAGSTRKLKFQVAAGGGTKAECVGNTTLTTGTWVHVFGSWTAGSGNRPHVYINGTDDGAASSSTGVTTIAGGYTDLNIGAFPAGSGCYLDGKVCQVRIYNADVSSTIATDYTKIINAGTNLVASWQLDDNYEDGSGNNKKLTAVNSPVFSADVPTLDAEELTNSIDLERGSSQYVSRADTASLSITGNLALEAWVKAESFESGGTNAIFNKRDSGTNRSFEFVVQDQGAGDYELVGVVSQDGTSGDQSVSVSNNFNPSTGTWYHVGFSYTTAGTISLFKDGVEVGYASQSTNATAVFDGNQPLDIGANRPTGSVTNYWDGKIFMARIWNATRTATNFSDNWCDELAAGTTNLVAQYTFNSSYLDSSGNNNTLTATGAPVFSADIPSICSGTAYTQDIDEVLTLNDTRTLLTGKAVEEALTLAETIARSTGKIITDAIALVETTANVLIANKAISETITLVETTTAKITARVITEVITLQETVAARMTALQLNVTITLQETLTNIRQYFKAIVEEIPLQETVAKVSVFGKTITETLALQDRIRGLLNGINMLYNNKYTTKVGSYFKKYLDPK